MEAGQMDFGEKIQVLIRCGYTADEAAKFIERNQSSIENNQTGLSEARFLELKLNLLRLGFKPETVLAMWQKYYNLTSIKIEEINKRFSNLLEKGFTAKQILKMWYECPGMVSSSVENINEKFNNLKAKGFDDKQIIKMWSDYSAMSRVSVENINEKFNYLKTKGFTDNQIIKMWYVTSSISSLSVENIDEKFNHLKAKGFTDKQIIKMWYRSSNMMGLKRENIDDKFDNFLKKGFKPNQIIEMCYKSPSIICYSSEKINAKFNRFLELGLRPEQVVEMWHKSPYLTCQSIERTEKQFELCRKYDLISYAISNPNDLMISPDLLEARINYFKENGIPLDKRVFDDNEAIYRKFNITREELLGKYGIESKDGELKVSQNSAKVIKEETSLQSNRSNSDYISLLRLEVQERKLMQNLKTFLQEEAVKDGLGYNRQMIETQEAELNRRKDELTEIIQLCQESSLSGSIQDAVSAALKEELESLQREFGELNRQKASYQVWLKEFQTKSAATLTEGLLKKYGNNPACKRLITALEEVRRGKQALNDFGHGRLLDTSKKSGGMG